MGSFCSHHPDTRHFIRKVSYIITFVWYLALNHLFRMIWNLARKKYLKFESVTDLKFKGHEEGSLLPFQTRTTGFYQQLDTDYQKVEQSVRKN